MSGIHTREEMYDLVWSTPMRTLTKRFGISDVALRKRCVKAAVPTPPSGYWTQLRVGCAPARPALLPRPLGMSCVVGPAAHRHSAATALEEDIETRLAPDEDWSPDRLRKRLRAEFAAYPTTTRGRLHPLIRARLDRDEVLRKRAARCRRQLPFDGPIFDSPFERRRLNLLNRLFLTCEAAGAKPSLSGRRANEISVTINHVTLHLLLADQAEIRRGHNAYPLELPAGNATLTLAILRGQCVPRWHRSWNDTKGNRLEGRIPHGRDRALHSRGRAVSRGIGGRQLASRCRACRAGAGSQASGGGGGAGAPRPGRGGRAHPDRAAPRRSPCAPRCPTRAGLCRSRSGNHSGRRSGLIRRMGELGAQGG